MKKRFPEFNENYRNRSSRLKGWRYAGFIGGIVGLIGATFYVVAIHPMLFPEGYQEIQKITRAGIDQEKIQPGNMKVWSDPFDRPEKNKRAVFYSFLFDLCQIMCCTT